MFQKKSRCARTLLPHNGPKFKKSKYIIIYKLIVVRSSSAFVYKNNATVYYMQSYCREQTVIIFLRVTYMMFIPIKYTTIISFERKVSNYLITCV